MVELAVDIFAHIVRSMVDAVVNFIALPAPQTEEERLPTSAELRAFFERRAREQLTQPPPPMPQTRPVEPAITPVPPQQAAPQEPETRAVPVQPAPQPARVVQEEPKQETPAAAPAPAIAPEPEHPATPAFVAQEAALNPNFGALPPAPHPVEHTSEALPPSPARSGKVDVEEFRALHLNEMPQVPLVQQSSESLPLSPARSGTVNVEEFRALHVADTGHTSTTPHSWDTLPLSPARFGDTGPSAHASAPAQPKPVAHEEAPSTPSDKEPAWPSLPPWPPPSARREEPQRSRDALRDRIRPAWYV